MLRSRAAAYDPHPDAKARAKQRLMAALAAEQHGPGGRPAAPPMTRRPAGRPPVDATAPLGRLIGRPHADDDPTSVTMQIPAVQVSDLDEEPIETERTEGTPITIGHSRRGRHTMPSRPGRFAGSERPARPERPSLRRRALLAGAAALVFMVALAGGGVFASRNALPGDSLYGVKRAAESAGLALTFDDATKARRQLELAATRLDEIERMARSQQNASADPALFRAAMQDFDKATGEGSRILLSSTSTDNAAALGDLRSWASTQSGRLESLSPSLPAKAGVGDSINLLDRLRARAAALESRSDCSEVTSGAVDDLGPLPAQGTCVPKPADPSAKPSRPGSTARGTGKAGSPAAGTAEPTPGVSSTGDPVATGDPTTAGGLLSGLDQPGLGLPSKVGTSGETDTPPTSTSTPKTSDNVNIPLPLPLVPPITLPPLLPGQPGITIG